MQKVQEGLSIELLKTDVADDKLYLLDVKDFSTPVESVEVFRKEPSTQLVVTVDGEFQHDYTLKGKYLEVVISKLKADEKPKPKSVLEKEGKLISINFQDIPVRNVLQLIADYNGFNLVVSDSVVGNLTLRLDGVLGSKCWTLFCKSKGSINGSMVM